MSNQHIVLTNQILREVGGDRAQIVDILAWLDDHPEQTPGRTITESRLREISYLRANAHGWDDRKMFEAAGVQIVPDPEPTNAEQWEKFCSELGIDLKPWQINYLSEAMDKRGVTAPGGDHE